ncbi:outer membrane protein [Allosphingosinicella deserti]|nr:outer membrane beta-barrel protein [Sphingomonas deserti]
MRGPASTLILLAIASASQANAQVHTSERPQDRFSGAYAGPEFGMVEHHFYIRETNPLLAASRGRYYRSWSAGGGFFAGYDLAVGARFVLGGEASVVFGGNAPEARFSDGSSYRAAPRYGYKVGIRLGRRFGGETLLYGHAGYGGYHYRVRAAGVSNPNPSGHSFTIGAGVERRLSSKIGVRIDLRHLDNQMSQLLIGLPARF